MSDLGWYLSGALGFALMCVIGVVWMLSKRSVHVHQENHNVAAPQVTACDGGGGSGVYPAIIGGVVKLLLAGFVVVFLANAVSSIGNGIGQGLQRIGDGLGQQAAPQPQQITVVYPTPVPVRRVEPIYVPQSSPQSAPVEVEWLTVAVVALAVAATSLWGYVAVTLLRRRTIKRPNVISGPRQVSAREVFGVATDSNTSKVYQQNKRS